MKTYVFTECSWWDDRCCSCCDATELIFYEPVAVFEDGVRSEFSVNGTPHSEEECYIACIELQTPTADLSVFYSEAWDLDSLRSHCEEVYGFSVRID